MCRSNAAAIILLLGLTISLGCISCADEPTGTEGNPCYPNKTCNEGLTCLSGYCVKVPVPDGSRTDGPPADGNRPDSGRTDVPRADLFRNDKWQGDGPRADAKVPQPDALQPDAKSPKSDLQAPDSKIVKPDAPKPDVLAPAPDAPLPDSMKPDALLPPDASTPAAIRPSTGIPCNWYSLGTAALDPFWGQYEFNTDDGSIYDKATTKYLRSKNKIGQAENGIYFNIKTNAGSPSIGVFVVGSINIVGGTVRLLGKNGFALLATGKISINGVINATGGSYSCPSGTSTTEVNKCAGPGGYQGGCYQSNGLGPGFGEGDSGYGNGAGGAGYAGKGGDNGGSNIAKGGNPYGLPTGLLVGGSGGGGTAIACGGGGGGAVQIVSATSIDVTGGGINVGGAGGITGDSSGGGSGGTILMEAPVVAVKTGAVLAANGGGGGCGGYGPDGESGALSCSQAAGGIPKLSGNGAGGKGGAGTFLSADNGTSGSSSSIVSGGGGGAAGRIVINTQSGKANLGTGCVASPASGTAAFTQGTVGVCP